VGGGMGGRALGAALAGLGEVEEVEGLEALAEVGLDLGRLPGVPQDPEEVVVRQEVEPRERPPPVLGGGRGGRGVARHPVVSPHSPRVGSPPAVSSGNNGGVHLVR